MTAFEKAKAKKRGAEVTDPPKCSECGRLSLLDPCRTCQPPVESAGLELPMEGDPRE